MVTVVDAYNFVHDYGSHDFLADRGETMGEDDRRTVVDLLTEQIEFCDVIVLNKTDLVTANDIDLLKGVLRALNSRAKILQSRFGEAPIDQILDTGLFDFEAASETPGWLKEMRGEHIAESEQYGITSFVYRARRPFHPQRFFNWIQCEWPGVVRSKGYFWLASRNDAVGEWSQAGAISRHGRAGRWWAAVPQESWPNEPEAQEMIRSRWDGRFGDRQQELVLIGTGMEEARLRASFDACLLSDEEYALSEAAWANFTDPFPDWTPRR